MLNLFKGSSLAKVASGGVVIARKTKKVKRLEIMSSPEVQSFGVRYARLIKGEGFISVFGHTNGERLLKEWVESQLRGKNDFKEFVNNHCSPIEINIITNWLQR